MKNTWVLVRRYFSQEVRNSNVLFSLGLYLVGVAYLIYLLNGGGVPADKTWNSLLWIVVFFGAIQLSARSFEYESNDYFYYYQTIAGPAETIIAKLLFNSAYIAVISALTWGLFSLFFGNPVFNTLLFGLALLLGSVGCSVVLTLTSGVAQRTQGNATLSAILALDETQKSKHICSFMSGTNTADMKSYKHDVLPEFGIGKEKDEHFWNAVLRQATVFGLLSKDIESFGVLSITEEGRDFIENPKSFG